MSSSEEAEVVVGAILIFNAISGICAIYGVIGINTCRVDY
ncbi:DUF2892 domain-containing protein [Bacteroidota bacterium]|nr:DUF2892 domain-containing protein [Bacteroidota bacterium]